MGVPVFGVSEFTTWPWTFDQDVENYSRLGIGAIEVCEAKLDPARRDEQLAGIAATGMKITSVQPRLHSLLPDLPRPQPVDPRERMALYRESIDLFGRHAPGTTMVTIGGAALDGDYDGAFALAVREYSELAKYAADHGVRIALEPLHPVLMNVDTFVHTIDWAMQVIEEVDHPSFGIFIDVWHVWEDAGLAEQLRRCGPRIFGVHVNDWRRPRAFGDRVSIGDGLMPLGRILGDIHASGYDGAYTLEIFSFEHLEGSLWTGDMAQMVARNRDAFTALWENEVRG